MAHAYDCAACCDSPALENNPCAVCGRARLVWYADNPNQEPRIVRSLIGLTLADGSQAFMETIYAGSREIPPRAHWVLERPNGTMERMSEVELQAMLTRMIQRPRRPSLLRRVLTRLGLAPATISH